MRRILLTTALGAASLTFASMAHADCDLVGGFGANTTVTCDATSIFDGPDAIETRGIDDGSDGTMVNVQSDAIIDTTSTVDGDGDPIRAVDLSGADDVQINNLGTIISADEGIQADDNMIVDNSGLIEAVEKGFDVDDNLNLTNQPTGVIRSTTNEGIESDDDVTIVNFGIIEGFDDAIQLGEDALITNHGTIRNTQAVGDVTDPDDWQDAIDIDSGTINNEATGKIVSVVDAAIDYDATTSVSTINNRGEISGTIAVGTAKEEIEPNGDVSPADEGLQIINNYAGAILEGTSGLALDLGLGDDALNMFGGKLVGAADFGGGNDTLFMDSVFIFNDLMSSFGGIGLLDGADGDDTAVFTGVDLADVDVKDVSGEAFTLSIGAASLMLNSWETFTFDDGSYSFAEIIPTAAVPLPGGFVLMGAGLAGLGLISRRRKGAAA